VKALNRIGATQTMEDFISFTLGIASNPNEALRPVYRRWFRLIRWTRRPRRSSKAISPVTGRCASAMPPRPSSRNDAYGSVILAAMPMFYDRRLHRLGDEGLFKLLESLGEKARTLAFEADNGDLGISRPSPLCTPIRPAMVGLGGLVPTACSDRHPPRPSPTGQHTGMLLRIPIHRALLEGACEPQAECVHIRIRLRRPRCQPPCYCRILGVIEADDPRFVSTVAAMERELLREKHVMRYAAADDFGLPATAFLICRFWLVDAWWSLGRREEARDLFVDALAPSQPFWACCRRILTPKGGALWGNFPQTYSMAGLILTAMRLSRSWGGQILARLIVVSNRVAVPNRDSSGQAGGLGGRHSLPAETASGHLVRMERKGVHGRKYCHPPPLMGGGMSYVVTDLAEADYQEYYNGFANRVLWPILHYRLDLAEFSRRDLNGYRRVNAQFATQMHDIPPGRRRHLGSRLSPDAARQDVARPWSPQQNWLLLACSISTARDSYGSAPSRMDYPTIERLRSCWFSN